MRIEDFDPADSGKVGVCYQMYTAGAPVDDPDGPVLSRPMFSGWFAGGWDGSPRLAALATSDDGTGIGGYLLELPDRENTHLGYLTILVAPGQRRHGRGSELLRHAAGRAGGLGRTLLSGETRVGSPGWAFAAAKGARAELVEVRRVLDLAGVTADRLASLRGPAESAAHGYSLLSWPGPTPGEHLDQLATVISAMADAPRSPGEQPHRMDGQRVGDNERRSAERGMRRYTVVARCDRTGELAAVTQVGVDTPNPSWGYQLFTAVTREHRGHRLGLLIKVAMLEWLAAAEPALRRIQTGNADSNRHMIAINAELGYEVLDEWQSWELDVAAVPAAVPAAASARARPAAAAPGSSRPALPGPA